MVKGSNAGGRSKNLPEYHFFKKRNVGELFFNLKFHFKKAVIVKEVRSIMTETKTYI